MRTLLTVLLALISLVPSGNAATLPSQSGVSLKIRMYLQGAILGVKQPSKLMRDDLRSNGLIPLQEPYNGRSNYSHYGELGGTEVIENPEILKVTGQDAIVDWVFVELRHPEFQKIVMSTRSALLQRDGDVVDLDGVSPLHFDGIEAGDYLVAVRHRNHLGVMSTQVFPLSETPILVDFTSPETKIYGKNPMIQIMDKMALFAGDANHDGNVRIEGPENDKDRIYFHVLLSPENVDANYNFILNGYDDCDINLDGMVKYQGPTSDGAYIAFDIVFFWRYNCPQVDKDCRLVEQMP
ncbi:MAG: hypothetical protein K9J37_03465 [Saprospiraceae bacterium]|nr:hypothetical protein [Saprospiraceae bacterium]MCF8248941.1 hypothetical protein [Saprospiraceae bacterium]MCF8279152.1 hypothetical protein [Bacteroidales bacterium]MCF8310835.1 hypothetical protein [Saprospiraceae bacterium]MCF8439577.1 hypothetical protein [Saprospiraceae bacterium]